MEQDEKLVKVYHWPKQESSSDLFLRLLEKLAARQFNDEYLELVIAYEKAYPGTEKFAVFYGAYALAHGNVKVALETLREGEKARRICPPIWRLLAKSFDTLGDSYTATYYRALLNGFCKEPLAGTIPQNELQKYLDMLTYAATPGPYAPATWLAEFTEAGFNWTKVFLIGRFLPRLYDTEEWRYFSGVYVEEGNINAHSWLIAQLYRNKNYVKRSGVDFVFDIQRAKEQQHFHLPCAAGETYLLPVAGLEESQQVRFVPRGGTSILSEDTKAALGKWAFQYYRVSEPVDIISEQSFLVGKPIPLGHSPKRKKLVINILVDALSWGAVKSFHYEDVPNLLQFFSKGIIFNNHFSAAEYTYPSFASIETGMYLHHNQVFNEKFGQEIAAEYQTISEKMKELGYYCVTVMGGGDGIHNGATRGFDRLLTSTYHLPAYEAVERTIRQIEAFSECDQYLTLHLMDVHTYSARTDVAPLATQTHLPVDKRLEGSGDQETSVNLLSRRIYQEGNRQGIRNTDRVLGTLFDYLEAHYSPEEYVVHLYSDHGVPVYDERPYVTSENQAGAAFMIRGAKIPSLGIVEELTSGVDIYSVMTHTVGFKPAAHIDGVLPKALGGEGRMYAFSNSIYPNKPYCLGIRDKEYEFRLESREKTGIDGTVNLTEANMIVYTRDTSHEVVEDTEIFQRFYQQAREFVTSIDNHGDIWPEKIGESL